MARSVLNRASLGRRLTFTFSSGSWRMRSSRPIALVGTTGVWPRVLWPPWSLAAACVTASRRAAHVEADAQLQIGRQQRAAVAVHAGLEVAEDGLHVAGRDGGTGQLRRRQQPLAVENGLHARFLKAGRAGPDPRDECAGSILFYCLKNPQ